MTALAEAFIALRADDTLLRTDVRRDAGRAGDEAGGLFGKRFSGKAKAGIAVAGVGIFAGIGAALRTGSQEVKDYQTGLSNLQAGLRSTGGVVGLTADQLEMLASRIQAYSGQTDDSIVSAEQLLLTFTAVRNEVGKGNDVFTQATEIAADMAQRLGGDAASQAIRLGKALQDPVKGITALRKAGVDFDAQQTKQITTMVEAGNVLGAQKRILAELRKEFGESARAFGGTDAGAIEKAKRDWEDLSQELTTELIPAFRETVKVVRGTTRFVQENESWLKPLAVGILAVVGAWKLYNLQAKIAVASTKLVGAEAVATTGKLATEGAVAGRTGGRLRGIGGAAAGAAGVSAIVAGQSTGGHVGGLLSGAGTGALIGSSLGPVGAGVGALLGGGAGFAKSFTGNNLDPATFAALAKTAGGRKELQQVVQLGAKIPLVGDHLRDLAQAALDAAKGEQSLGKEAAGATPKMRDQAKVLARTQRDALDLAGAHDSLASAVHNMAVVVGSQSSRALRGNSDAALANRDALRGAVTSALDYLNTLKAGGATRSHVLRQELNLAHAVERNASETYGNKKAVDRLLRSLGFMPGQIQAVIDKYNELHKVWFNPQSGTGADSPFLDPGHPGFVQPPVKEKAKHDGQSLGRSLVDGYSDVVDPGLAAATTAATDAAHQALQTARSRMRQDFQTIKQAFASEKQSLISTFGSLSTTPGTDSLGASFAKPPSVRSQLRQGARQMETFARLWHRLDNKHLDPRLLAQFAGPEYIPAMRELLQSGRRGIQQVNRLEGRIGRAAGSVASTATSDQYGRLIHSDLQDLPIKLARHFAKDLRHINIHVRVSDVDRSQGHRAQVS